MAFFTSDRYLIEKTVDDKVAYLITADSGMEAEIICALLRSEDVPCMARDRSDNRTARVFTGLSNLGTDIFVARAKLDEAKAIIEAYVNSGAEDDEATENEEK